MRARAFAAVAVALTLAACGGGGSTPPPAGGPQPPGVSPGGTLDPRTSALVSIGTDVFGQTALDVTNVGSQSMLGAADTAPGAVVVYPDGSTQLTDSSGRFDASRSAYAATNRLAFLADANRAPAIVTFANDGLVSGQTGTVFTTAGAAIPAVGAIATYAGSPSAALAPLAIAVRPASVTVFGGQSASLAAVVRTADGDLAGAAPGVTYNWSLAKPAGCAFPPSGTIAQDPNDPSKARYVAPGTGGDFAPNCPDLVVATASAAGAVVASSSAMHVYDRATAAQIAGTLTGSNQRPIAGGVILFSGTGADAYNGTVAVHTSQTGGFRARIPFYRNITPVAFIPSGAGYAVQSVAPTTLTPSTATGLTSQAWTVGGAASAMPPPPVPDVLTPVSDQVVEGRIAGELLPFGGAPSAAGPAYGAGTYESVVHTAPASATGSISSGAFRGWRYVVSADGATVAFVSGGRTLELIIVTRASGGAFAFARYRRSGGSFDVQNISTVGARLVSDGGWSESIDGAGVWHASLLLDDVLPGGAPNAPYAAHNINAQQAIGSTTMTITDQWSAIDGTFLGTLTASRTTTDDPNASTTTIAYSATLQRRYAGSSGTANVSYAIAGPNGPTATATIDTIGTRTGAETFTVTASPSQAEVGLSLALLWPLDTTTCAGIVCGTATVPAIAPFVTAGATATYAVDLGGVVTGAYATALGGQSFRLAL